MLLHELDRLAPRADHGADEVAFLLRHFDGRHADDVVERRQHLARDDDGAVLVLDLRPQRLGDRRDVDQPGVERRDPLAEAAGLDELGVGLACSPPACSSISASAWLVERGFV